MKTHHYQVEYKGKKLLTTHHIGAMIGVKKKIDLDTDRERLEKEICREGKFRKVEILRLDYLGESDPYELMTKMTRSLFDAAEAGKEE